MIKYGTKIEIVDDPKAYKTKLLKSLIGKTGVVRGNQLGSNHYRNDTYYSIELNDGTNISGIHQDSVKPIQ